MKKIISLLLTAALAGTAAVSLSGCGASESKADAGEVNVYTWGEYMALGQDEGIANVVEQFEKETNIKVNLTTYDTNEELYSKLTQSNDSYDIVVPSDYMIGKMIKEGQLKEINYKNIPNYQYIDERFKKLPCDPEGKYTVCYTWGVTAIVYDKNKVKNKPTDWDALWDKNLKGQILMFNNSRDAMGIAMQQCGIDPSNCNKADIDKAVVKLREQKPLLKKYVMDQVFNEMEGGQAAIASYYAGDIAMMMEENEDLDYCLPVNGSNLFYDAMCIPKSSQNTENAEKFINFMQKPEIAAENCKYLRYGTPNTKATDYLDDDIKNSELTFPPKEYVDKCYVFKNLSDDVYAYMQEQFVKVQAE